MAHDPMEHVIDEQGQWTIFTDLFGGFSVPLLNLRPYGIPFSLSKFMILELVAAGLIIAIYVPIARRVARGDPPTGAWWNAFESLLTFIRNEVARPTLTNPNPHHDEGHGEQHGEGHGEHHGAEHAAAQPHEP